MSRAGQLARGWLPPMAFDLLRSRFGSFRFQGDYSSWKEAYAKCSGYSSEEILERVRKACWAVQEGRAAFERDSVAFDRIEYAWPLLAGLLWIAVQRKGRLHVLDFGGSLGTSYRQNRRFLTGLDALKWSIIEQPHFVECGRKEFEDGNLRFFHDLDECLRFGRPDVVLFSSVLHYLEKPFETLESVLEKRFDFLLIDRTPFVERPEDRLCIQKTSSRIYKSSYPAWFFSRVRFLDFFKGRYELVEEFEAQDRANIPSRYLGFLFKREGASG